MRPPHVASAGLAVAGGAILIALLFVSWYGITIQASDLGIQITSTSSFQLGTAVTQTQSCSGSSLCPASTSNSTTYSDLKWHDTGDLYQSMQYVAIAGAAVAIAGAALLVVRRDTSAKTRSLVLTMMLIAAVLALVVPVALLAYQPTAMNNDGVYQNVTTARSFFGSCAGSACGVSTPATVSAAWAPALGWYLSFAAFGLLAVALVLAAFRGRPPVSEAATKAITSAVPESSSTPAPAPRAETSGLIACRQCGHVYPVGVNKFCPNCGAVLEGGESWSEG